MTSNSDWVEWEGRFIQQIANGVRQAREAAGLSQRALADRVGLSQGAINNLESGTSRVKQTPTIAVLIRIALATGRPPIELLYPDLPVGAVEAWPGAATTSIEAAQWFSGHLSAWQIDRSALTGNSTNARIQKARQYFNAKQALEVAKDQRMNARATPHGVDVTVEEADDYFVTRKKKFEAIKEELRKEGWPVDD
ncbi:helix-turn-helix domain-containing protein [Nocardia vinacea]|uniref:Helix-turn-helix domain-containing protein n=1 Tax=Nocardia vinacea TaxID=96468 RepID=A0ABZ1YXN3_9NOCA|nr:helix-turn-helix transcriptional regulator [Nocardia vinacea]